MKQPTTSTSAKKAAIRMQASTGGTKTNKRQAAEDSSTQGGGKRPARQASKSKEKFKDGEEDALRLALKMSEVEY